MPYREEQIKELVEILQDSNFEEEMMSHYGLKESTRLLSELMMEGVETVGIRGLGFSFL